MMFANASGFRGGDWRVLMCARGTSCSKGAASWLSDQAAVVVVGVRAGDVLVVSDRGGAAGGRVDGPVAVARSSSRFAATGGGVRDTPRLCSDRRMAFRLASSVARGSGQSRA